MAVGPLLISSNFNGDTGHDYNISQGGPGVATAPHDGHGQPQAQE
jgi:hypothetical protein